MSFPTFTVLMVEDLAADRELYRRSLHQESNCLYELLEAESIAAGLELCQTRSIDAILLDYRLPDGDGLDFLTELSMQSNGRMPPVVMMTGQGNENTAVRAIKLGAEDYLVKRDLTPELLQLKVRKSIENARLRQQQQQELIIQKQAELSLQAANQQTITIWESMTDAYVTLDRDWQIVYTNPTATKVYYQTTGLVPEEYLAKIHWEVFPWTVGTIVEREYRRAVAEQVTVNFELFYEPTQTWFEIHGYPSTEGLGIYFRDINQRKLDELARRAAERERDRFFDLSLDLLMVANLEGYFVRVNPACEHILGFISDEMMAQPYIGLVHPDDRAATMGAVERLNVGDALINFENRYRCKDGSYRWILWSARLDEELDLIYANGHDITDRKRDQVALEKRNKELDAFVFVVSHDLKAPLRAVANLSQWIEEDLEGELTADTQLQMNLLRSRVNRMSATIDGLLEYARIGRSEDRIESVAMACLLADVVDEVAPPPTFTIDLPDDLPTLSTKRLPLFQIFVNLVGNGIKHHHSETGLIKISIEDRGDWYEFAIADDGPGIALEHQEQMFKIFQAVNPQNRSDSTGIGLAIVKKIVEAEGGTIWLESEIGHGTTFYFTWPKCSRRPNTSTLGT